uniref:Uncharacterized protein n=1 Tax=Spongospora subterranea TaxID=70186 RepID=A0A0H5RRK0_9EUKA|eukprot:CRZ11334.1 hypothetical protein [Spongospora subterranea]
MAISPLALHLIPSLFYSTPVVIPFLYPKNNPIRSLRAISKNFIPKLFPRNLCKLHLESDPLIISHFRVVPDLVPKFIVSRVRQERTNWPLRWSNHRPIGVNVADPVGDAVLGTVRVEFGERGPGRGLRQRREGPNVDPRSVRDGRPTDRGLGLRRRVFRPGWAGTELNRPP